MRGRAATAIGATLLLLAGCRERRAEPAPGSPEQAPAATAPALPSSAASSEGAEASVPIAPVAGEGSSLDDRAALLDRTALSERRDPDRLLRFYAAALRQGRWSLAASAWRSSSGVTAATLKSAYDRGRPPGLTLGKGKIEGAAGSLYYEVPVTLRFVAGPPQTGTLTLRRVNDVPGASAEQLAWRIERSTIGAGQ
ncbi:MAG: hypothetical protein ABIT04_01115 [Novosphingobium sp.]